MHHGLAGDIGHWTNRVLAAIETGVGAASDFDVRSLAAALAPAAFRNDCPRVRDVCAGSAATYRRIPLTSAAARDYEALLIVWPPDHVTPVHDHDGLWGIEFILDGVLEVESFALTLEPAPQLVSRDTSVLGIGDHAAFSGADYAHRCRNLSSRQPALSLHVYGGALDRYRSFHREDAGRWVGTEHRTVREAALA